MSRPQDFREQLPELLDEHAPKRAPGHLFDRFAERMDDAPQRPGWATRERWFPMDSSIRLTQAQRMVVIAGAVLLLAVALAVAFVAGSSVLTGPTTIIVAADGSGNVTTLREGVAMAGDGDTIKVRPGRYEDAVTIEHDVILEGDGETAQIQISAPDDGPSTTTGALADQPAKDQPYALLINGANPTVNGLTFSRGSSAVVIIGGAPTIEGNRFVTVGRAAQDDEDEAGPHAIVVKGGSRASIRDNELVGGGSIASYDLSEPVIEDNRLRNEGFDNGGHILGGFGDRAVIRGNQIYRPHLGIEAYGDAAPLIEGNVITDAFNDGIRAAGGAAVIRGNTVTHPGDSSRTGITYSGGAGTIENNTVRGIARAVAVTDFTGTIDGNTLDAGMDGVTLTDSTGTVSDNQIKAVFTGITMFQSSADVLDNRIEGSARGVSVVGESSAPSFSGNELCGTAQAMSATDGATLPDQSGLEECADA